MLRCPLQYSTVFAIYLINLSKISVERECGGRFTSKLQIWLGRFRSFPVLSSCISLCFTKAIFQLQILPFRNANVWPKPRAPIKRRLEFLRNAVQNPPNKCLAEAPCSYKTSTTMSMQRIMFLTNVWPKPRAPIKRRLECLCNALCSLQMSGRGPVLL